MSCRYSDVVTPAIRLYPGDEVQFNIFVEKRSGRKGATAIKLTKCNPIGRERGIVCTPHYHLFDIFACINVSDIDTCTRCTHR
jgi:hypothetical protein